MERETAKGDRVPLDSTLTEMIMNPKSQKIRRPPNAFMLFAREHRRLVSKQHPNISNKTVSTILGRMWKGIPPAQKEEYYRNASLVSQLHKERYPEYVYSPIEARMKKRKKMKQKDEIKNIETAEDRGDLKGADEFREGKGSNEEDWRIMDANSKGRSSSPGYVPNNPQYFTQQSSETSNDESSAMEQRLQCSPEAESFKGSDGTTSSQIEMDCPRSPRHGRGGCCDPSRMGFRNRCFSLYEKDGDETMPCFTDRPPYSPFYNSARPWTRPLSPLYCGPPCTSPVPPFLPHWNLPPVSIPYFQTRDCVYEDFQPCSLPAPCRTYTPDYYSQHYGYFNRPVSRMLSSPTPRFIQMEEEWNRPPKSTYEDFARDKLELESRFKEMDKREVKMLSFDTPNPRSEGGMCLRNRKIVGPEVTNKGQFSYFSQSDSGQQEVSSSNMNGMKPDEMCPVNSFQGEYQNDQQLAGIGNYRRNIEEVSSSGEYFPARDFRNSMRNLSSEEISNSYAVGSYTPIRNVSSCSTITSPDSTKIIPGIPDQNTIIDETADYIKVSNQNFHKVYKSHGFQSDQPLRSPVHMLNSGACSVYGGSVEKLNDLPKSCFSENDASVTEFKRPPMNLNRMPNEFHSTNLCEDDLRNNFKKVEEVDTVSTATKIIEDTSCETPSADQNVVEVGGANQKVNINASNLRLYGPVRKMPDFQNSRPMNLNRRNTENRYSDENTVIFHGSTAKRGELCYSNSPPPLNPNRSKEEAEKNYGNQSISDFKSRITGYLNQNYFIPVSESNYERGSDPSTKSEVYRNVKSEASPIRLTTVTNPSYVHLKCPEEQYSAGNKHEKQCNRSFSLQQKPPAFSTFISKGPYQTNPKDNEVVNQKTTNETGYFFSRASSKGRKE